LASVGVDESRCLDELEGIAWGPAAHESSLVVNAHRLRRVPLRDFTPGDLRLMIGQRIGLRFLLPLAVGHLEIEPLLEATYYPGDLLSSVASVEEDDWRGFAGLRQRLDTILATVQALPPEIQAQVAAFRSRAG
jgi:hypothetical protein